MNYKLKLRQNYLETIPSHIYFLMKKFKEFDIQTRLVGGAVRDILMGNEPKDYDLVFSASPDRFLEVCQQLNYKVVLDGFSHGIIKVVTHSGLVVDFAACRRDVFTDGRHAKVEYGESFVNDAKRRDFTFNSMSIDINGKLHDPNLGVRDLEAGEIRFIGNSADRIKEDYLRILRFVRFMVRYDLTANEFTIHAVRRYVHGLNKISKERIAMEIKSIFGHFVPAKCVKFMNDSGLSDYVFGFKLRTSPKLSIEDVESFWIPNLLRYVPDGKESKGLAFVKQYPFSNKEKKTFVAIYDGLRDFVLSINKNYVNVKYPEYIDQIGAYMNVNIKVDVPKKPYTGSFVMEAIPGLDLKHISTVLAEMDKYWARQDFKPQAIETLRMVIPELQRQDVIGPEIKNHMKAYIKQLDDSISFLEYSDPAEAVVQKNTYNKLKLIWGFDID